MVYLGKHRRRIQCGLSYLGCRLYSTYPTDNRGNCTENDRAIEKEVLVPNIVKVILEIFMNRKSSRGTDLPQAGYPWFRGKSLAIDWMIAIYNKRHLRSGTDQAHL